MTHYQKSDPKTIQNMFNSIARRYDRTNAVLSLGMHKLFWNKKLVDIAKDIPSFSVYVDLCAGTGDIAFEYLKRLASPTEAYLVDFCEQMLICAQEKAKKFSEKGHTIKFIAADVQKLPLNDNMADFISMAYGIRNVKNPDEAIKEAYRVLKPEGKFAILELTQPTNPVLRFGHRLYLKTALPLLGKWLTSNQAAYEYLCNSIHTFLSPEMVRQKLVDQGFTQTGCIPLTGGIATIITGRKE